MRLFATLLCISIYGSPGYPLRCWIQLVLWNPDILFWIATKAESLSFKELPPLRRKQKVK